MKRCPVIRLHIFTPANERLCETSLHENTFSFHFVSAGVFYPIDSMACSLKTNAQPASTEEATPVHTVSVSPSSIQPTEVFSDCCGILQVEYQPENIRYIISLLKEPGEYVHLETSWQCSMGMNHSRKPERRTLTLQLP